MSLKLLAGSANLALAQAIAINLGAQLVQRILDRFPDGELHLELQESVRGCELRTAQRWNHRESDQGSA